MKNGIIAATAAIAMMSASAAGAQQSAGKATVDATGVVVTGVTVMQPGYLVVKEQLQDGASASDPIGFTAVQPGENQEYRIQGDFSHGGDFVIMLYRESGAQDDFQWSDGVEDLPVTENGEHVTTTFERMMDDGDSETDS